MNDYNLNIHNAIDNFATVSLEKLESYELINRYDIKYIINIRDLPLILNALKNEYSILEYDKYKIFTYNNLYFDTIDYYFYNQHHNGKLNRSKIRFRGYIESGFFFFEIKNKINFYRTTKERIRTNKISNNLSSQETDFIAYKLNINPHLLFPKLSVNYNRMTLLHTNGKIEKITIDTNISFKNTIEKISIPDIAILEIKQQKYSKYSSLLKYFRLLNIKFGGGFSKYCLGLALADKNVKYNRFKPKILSINKIISDYE